MATLLDIFLIYFPLVLFPSCSKFFFVFPRSERILEYYSPMSLKFSKNFKSGNENLEKIELDRDPRWLDGDKLKGEVEADLDIFVLEKNWEKRACKKKIIELQIVHFRNEKSVYSIKNIFLTDYLSFLFLKKKKKKRMENHFENDFFAKFDISIKDYFNINYLQWLVFTRYRSICTNLYNIPDIYK